MPETATVSVPMVDLKAQYARIREEIDAAVSRVVAGGQFIGGEECRLLEEEFARYCGAAHACGVANGTGRPDPGPEGLRRAGRSGDSVEMAIAAGETIV
jgi:hypothetical protein